MSAPFKKTSSPEPITLRRVATVDSVKDGFIHCTIASTHKTTPVQGGFVLIEAVNNVILGRVVTVDMHNPIHEDDRFASLLMENGSVPEWSGFTDIERGIIEVVAVIDDAGAAKSRDVNPKSGTPIIEVNQAVISRFYQELQHYAVVGAIAGSDASATIINRSFGAYEDGGYGEARHMGIFGKNGSGKTVFLLILLCLKLAAHQHMGLLLPDTQGDFADSTRHSRGDFKFDYKKLLARAGVDVEVIQIENIVLRSTGILKGCLRRVFINVYAIHPDKAELLASHVVNSLFDDRVDEKKLTAKIIGGKVVEYIGQVYAKTSRKEKEEDAARVLEDAGRLKSLENELKFNVRPYFTGDTEIEELVRDVLTRGRKAIISMERMPEKQQILVMEELLRVVKATAQGIYKSGKASTAQAIIVLDEAPRWCPQTKGSEIEGLAHSVLSGMKETRKAGLGWWICGQSPADVDKTVLKQAHMTWFGRGLGIGADGTHLETVLGKAGLEHYKSLQMQAGRFFWIGTGLDNNVGTDTSITAVLPFGGDANADLISSNPHIFGAK